MNITPSLLTYALLILTIYYIFAMIGMEIFGDIIKSQSFNPSSNISDCSNLKLIGSDFARYSFIYN